MRLHDLLGSAYTQAIVRRNRPAAIKELRATLAADPELAAEAKAELRRLNTMLQARGFGRDRTPCTVSSAVSDLLSEVLGSSP